MGVMNIVNTLWSAFLWIELHHTPSFDSGLHECNMIHRVGIPQTQLSALT